MYNNSGYFPYQSGFSSYMPRSVSKPSLFSKLKNGVNWDGLLNNTSKTLNVINQAIPLYYQVRPLIRNASTLFKIADIIRTDDRDTTGFRNVNARTNNSDEKKEVSDTSSGPTFFL